MRFAARRRQMPVGTSSTDSSSLCHNNLPVGEITELLNRWKEGDQVAFEQLVDLVYDEMRGVARRLLASERNGHTLQCTALVHEAYLRLVDQTRIQWQGRAHFFSAAANAMRRVLVDHARKRLAAKRGNGATHTDLADAYLTIAFEPDLDVVALDEALTEFSLLDPARARLVELRYFAGLSIEETAALLQVSPSAVNRDWAVARVWLYRRLSLAR